MFYFGIWDIDPIYFGIWDIQEFWDMGMDIGNYFGIQVKLILGYGIFWTVYFGILPTPLTKPHDCLQTCKTKQS